MTHVDSHRDLFLPLGNIKPGITIPGICHLRGRGRFPGLIAVPRDEIGIWRYGQFYCWLQTCSRDLCCGTCSYCHCLGLQLLAATISFLFLVRHSISLTPADK